MARDAVFNGAPRWFVTELFENQEKLQCAHAAAIVVLSGGDLLVQKRREGLQVFGGGRHQLSFLNKLHSVRRELFMESNLLADYSATALVRISAPCLVYDVAHGYATL